MNFPVPPIGPRSDTPPITPVARSKPTRQREQHEEDQRREQDEQRREPPPPPVADDDGHIDVLA
jgi:hypothetical protein